MQASRTPTPRAFGIMQGGLYVVQSTAVAAVSLAGQGAPVPAVVGGWSLLGPPAHGRDCPHLAAPGPFAQAVACAKAAAITQAYPKLWITSRGELDPDALET